MSLTLDQLEQKLLALPVENRERLAFTLLESVGPHEDREDEFSPQQLAEFERRSTELLNGSVVGIPYETVMRQLDELLSRG